eukprot:CAMPEP_0197537072 /NCGR_PEP_ID=MMETSP1318-20131121/55746_1 /TAXON_ID=552666 /ORGANISM="Partenskyella glossopodia, Strain RCC365" /LENGTH=391 /DNA_ID=CAMNT_0043095137 /DNA_START=293 /DNA_END=1468 /DNA_ORIENTATION=+
MQLQRLSKIHKALLDYIQHHAGKKRIDEVTIHNLFEDESLGIPLDLQEKLFFMMEPDERGTVSLPELIFTIGILKAKIGGKEHKFGSSRSSSVSDDEPAEKRYLNMLFTIYDLDQTGALNKEEFTLMLHATLNAKLIYIIQDETAVRYLQKHMEEEMNAENLLFYKACKEVEELKMDRETFQKKCIEIYTSFIQDGSQNWINLFGKRRKPIEEVFEPILKSPNDPVLLSRIQPGIFNEAKKEIYHMMERDVHQRFVRHRHVMDQLVEALWSKIDTNKDGKIHLEELQSFAKGNPDFLRQVEKIVNGRVISVSPRMTHDALTPETKNPPSNPLTGTSEEDEGLLNEPKLVDGLDQSHSQIDSDSHDDKPKEKINEARSSSFCHTNVITVIGK